MIPVRAMEVTGSDAPDKTAKLTVHITDGPRSMRYAAYYEPGFCGCADCHCLTGYGYTPETAIEEYWEAWEGKYVQ